MASAGNGSSVRPIVTVEELTDPSTAGAEVLSQDIVDLGAKPFSASRVTILLGRCVVVFHSTNSHVRSQTSLPEERMGFLAIGANSRATLDGRLMAPELMLVVEAGAQGQLVADPGYESVTCLISPEELARELLARQRLDGFSWPQGTELRRPEPQCLLDFFDLGKRLVDAAVRQPALFGSNEAVRASAQCDVLEALLAAVASATEAKPSRSDRTRRDYGRIVESAQEFALRHCTERVYVRHLCRAAHVSERTLQQAFREATGMTPVAYLTRVRLHKARQRLAEAAPGSKTVTAVAHEWGFWHMGEFSRLYKECFDDLPSDTLRWADGTLAK